MNPIDQAVEAKNLIIQGKDKEIEELAHKLKILLIPKTNVLQ